MPLVLTRPRRPIFVSLIIILNVIVYGMWLFTGDPDAAGGTELSPHTKWMIDNFTVSWTLLQEGRWWTLLTSVFSHNILIHIFINMYVLQSFGSIIESVIGHWRFLTVYLVAGVVSSFSHSFVSAFIIGNPDLAAVGASGSISALVLLFALMFPREKILLFGLLPLPALFGALAFIGLDIWGLVAQAEGGGLPIGHGAHLGGAFTGIVYYFMVMRPRLKR